MSSDDMQELKDRNLVPSDELDHLNILRYDPREPPTVGIFDAPLRSHVMNLEWSKHIMGAVSGLEFWKAWTGDEDELNSAVQSIYEFMVGEVCGMFLLRQNTTNSCLLEQSVDGGDNWTPAFDFSLCISGGSDAAIQIYIDIAITNIAILNQLYIDAGLDIIIMYPNLEYDAGPEDDDRNTALCYALEALTEGVFNAVEERILNLLDKQALLSSIVKFMTGGWWASDGSLLAALSNAVVDAIFGTDALEAAADALANTGARRNIVCCLYGNLEGSTVTYALWQNARDTCSFDPGSDEELLLDILDPLFAGLDAYLSWVTLLSNGVDLATANIIGNDCLTCGEWLAVIDFTVDDGGYVLDQGPAAQDWGNYVVGVGWDTTLVLVVSSNKWQTGCAIQLLFTGGTYTLRQSTLTFDYVLGDWDASSQLAQRITREATHTIVNAGSTNDGDDQTLNTPNDTVPNVTKHRLFIRSSQDDPEIHDYGEALMTKIEIRGMGDIPPELAAYIV